MSAISLAISAPSLTAIEIADITIGADNLEGIVVLKHISDALMKRIHNNYRTIVGFNTGLILLGVAIVLELLPRNIWVRPVIT